jgi:peptidylprolyl isomerase
VNESTQTPAGVISAITVLVVLGLLALLLFNRANEPTSAQPEADAPGDLAGETATQPPELATALAIAEATAMAQAAITPEPAPTTVEADPETLEQPALFVPEPGEVIEGRPAFAIDPESDYTATITTPRGEIVVELFPEIAPQNVNAFVALARDGFYDGLTWHRVLPDFMAQGGDPEGTGTGGPGFSLPGEFTNQIAFDRPGLVAMARSNDPDSAGSQFFITTAPAPWLDGQYTIIGEVIEGQEIANNIPLRDPATASEPGEEIVGITIEES